MQKHRPQASALWDSGGWSALRGWGILKPNCKAGDDEEDVDAHES